MSVDDYLAELRVRLRVRGPERELLLAEAEDHLRETVVAGLAAGLTRREAEEAAVSAFGSVGAVVRAHRARHGKVALLVDAVFAAWKLGSAGLVAVGASGLIAAVMNSAFGRSFVGAAASGSRFAADRCRYWLSIWHQAHTCLQAATLESSSDAVSLRVAAGIVGLILLAGYWVVRSAVPRIVGRTPWPRDSGTLSRDWFPALAALGSGGAALLMTVLLTTRTFLGVAAGPGFYLSGILAALAVCAFSSLFALRRRPPRRIHS